MNCKEANELLLKYIEGNLPPDLKNELEKHLSECTLCQKNLALTQLENSLLHDTSDIPELNTEFTRRVMEKVKNLAAHSQGKTITRKFIYAFSALAACLIMVLVGHHIHGDYAKTKNTPPPRIAMEQKEAVYKLATAPDKEKASELAGSPMPAENKAKSFTNETDTQNGAAVDCQPKPKIESQFVAKSNQQIMMENTSENMMNIKLAGIPDTFVLQKTELVNENKIIYVYLNNNDTVIIEVWPSDREAKLTDKSSFPSSLSSENKLVNNAAAVTKKLGDKTYNIAISGNINEEKLEQLLNNLELKKAE